MVRRFNIVLTAEGFSLQILTKNAPKKKTIEGVVDLKNRRLHPSDIPSVNAVDNNQKF